MVRRCDVHVRENEIDLKRLERISNSIFRVRHVVQSLSEQRPLIFHALVNDQCQLFLN